MADTSLLEVATPERLMVRENVSDAQIPAADGYVGILPGHAAMLSELGSGVLSYTADGHNRSLHIAGGWLEVSNDHARVLATAAGDTDLALQASLDRERVVAATKETGASPSPQRPAEDVVQRLQTLKSKIAELQKDGGSFGDVSEPAASKSRQQVPIICRVIDDAVRAYETGRDINGRPISPVQLADGIRRLAADTRKQEFQFTLSLTLGRDAIGRLESYMNELEAIARDIR